MIFPENFENKIDFSKVREYIKEHCLSELGQTLVDDMTFMTNAKSIKQRLGETAEFKIILDRREEFPVEHYFDLRPPLKKLDIRGAFLETKELFQLGRSMHTVKAIVRFFKKEDSPDLYPKLKEISDNVVLYPYVTDGIDRIVSRHGKIRDNASPELANIRRELISKQSEASKLIHRLIAKAQTEGWVDKDTSLSMRDGRAVIPVPASFKRKIPGIIHDESATGKTCYVEPTPVVEINNELSELEAEERREIVRILKEFTDTIRPYKDDLEDSIVFLGIMDFIRAKAKFADRINAILPKIKSEPHLKWEQAVHPVLFLSFQEENREVVPLDITLEAEQRILLISGPNAGGKSVCLKTVGLLQYMLQCGMLIPVQDKSEAGIFKHIFIDIGDEQSIENDLSTYSSHLMNMKHFSKNADDRTLILIDEFGTGTEPMLGGAIAESVLNKLNENKVFGVITTHYTNLKHFAAEHEGIINGAMLYDVNKLEPLFKLEVGKPGSSFAFEIAYKIGLPQDVIDDAREKVGEDHIQFDKHLKEILRDKRYWERKRQNIRKVEKRLEELLEKEKQELEQAKQIRKETLSKAESEAKKILADSNKIIETTVRKIKEAQAEKEKTKEVRKDLNEFKEKIEKQDPREEERIKRKMQKLKDRENRVKQGKEDKDTMEPEQLVQKKPKKKQNTFTIGMPVRISGQSSVGEIIELTKKTAVVAFGNMLTTVDIKKLEALSAGEKKTLLKQEKKGGFKQALELNQRRVTFKPGLDVRGKRADDALQMVTEFIDEAVMVGAFEVKILHGTGSGILRQLIRQYLNTIDVVTSVKDEHIEFGGAGITVVKLG